MQVFELNSAERDNGGFTHHIVIDAAGDLTQTTANTAQVLELISVKAGDALLNAATHLETKFQDASDAAFNTTPLTVGDGSDADRAINSQELNVNGTEVVFAANDPAKLPYVFTADDTIDATFGSMAAKALNDIDTGKLHVYLRIARLPRLSGTAL
jgi:hypothetical protein